MSCRGAQPQSLAHILQPHTYDGAGDSHTRGFSTFHVFTGCSLQHCSLCSVCSLGNNHQVTPQILEGPHYWFCCCCCCSDFNLSVIFMASTPRKWVFLWAGCVLFSSTDLNTAKKYCNCQTVQHLSLLYLCLPWISAITPTICMGQTFFMEGL